MKQHETLPLITISWGNDLGNRESDISGKVFPAALEQELALRPLGNTVYFMPPYITDEQEMDLLVAGTPRALESC
jgi:adenosylmethionine-8-amino-7-oxononanoate aminotransferase